MREMIKKWFSWLKQAASSEPESNLHNVYSDGRQLWAGDGYSLHVEQVALEKTGVVSLNDDDSFQVTAANGHMPDFATGIPQDDPQASIIVDARRLRQALDGQSRFVRLNIYGDNLPLELSSAGSYAAVMPIVNLEEAAFWRPET
ncbi:MAG: hypothetical protein GY803_10475 [Chloroflexi bacterium]|nr:hypothetical protein [Chloroflexota bacterium]